MDRTKASRARQGLLQTEAARRAHVEVLVRAQEMIAGALFTVERRCGKPNCHCASGEGRHVARYLSRSEEGRTRLLYVSAQAEPEVQRKAERYRRFRQARAELMKLAAQTARFADELQAELTESFPPQEGRRGRRRGRGLHIK